MRANEWIRAAHKDGKRLREERNELLDRVALLEEWLRIASKFVEQASHANNCPGGNRCSCGLIEARIVTFEWPVNHEAPDWSLRDSLNEQKGSSVMDKTPEETNQTVGAEQQAEAAFDRVLATFGITEPAERVNILLRIGARISKREMQDLAPDANDFGDRAIEMWDEVESCG